jgi:mevalonate kinase
VNLNSIALRAKAPSKIIITGEHAVVYGMPAIVTAINRFAYAEIVSKPSRQVSLQLADLKERVSSTFSTLRELKMRLVDNYRLFMNGSLQISKVLQKPTDLFQFAVVCLFDMFQIPLQKGFHLNVRSEIPIGCGMGSSAATIVSTIQALALFLKLEIKPEWLYSLSVEAERLQHGFSSGVDAYVSLNGGCVRFQGAKATPISLPKSSFFLINTGRPESMTGECVSHVAKGFKTSAIWQEFGHLAVLFEEALKTANSAVLNHLIRANHALLVRIGVVPKKVQSFISELETLQIAAKTCGAGAVRGERGGVVMAIAEKAPYELCAKYGYEIIDASAELQGASLAV